MIKMIVGVIVFALLVSPLTYMFYDYPFEEYVEYASSFLYGLILVGETITFIACRRNYQHALEVMWSNQRSSESNFLVGIIIGIVSISSLSLGYDQIGLAAAYILIVSSLNHSLIRRKYFTSIENDNP